MLQNERELRGLIGILVSVLSAIADGLWWAGCAVARMFRRR
jgi:hypothetical protein